MAKQGQNKKSGGLAKYGRNKQKCASYRAGNRRFKSKLKKVLRCNGPLAAELYRQKYGK